MDNILWVLNNERHCSGWHCDLVRHFLVWTVTVGSKVNGYGYESNGGLHFELYHNDGKKNCKCSPSQFTITTETGALKTYNFTGFHTWVTCFSSYTTVTLQLILMHWASDTTHDRVSCNTTKATTSRTAIMVPSHSFNKWFQVKYTYIRYLLNKPHEILLIMLFCTMPNQCTIKWHIITPLLHVSSLLCHPQGACSQYLAKLHKFVKCSCW